MDRRVTSPTWGPPPPCNQALGNKARVDLVLIQLCLLYYVNHVFVILNSIFLSEIYIRKGRKSVSKQGHPQPYVHSKARAPNPIQTLQEETRHYC